jgi:opacity protein-like surface antigen
MNFSFRLLASCAALAIVPAVPALAADYNPPIYVEQAPEWVPVEIGSGWYLRGDISYNAAKPTYNFSYLGEDVEHHRIGGSVGFGYHVTDSFRADMTVAYLGGDKFSLRSGPDSAEASHTVWSGLVNGYFDLGTVVGVTPYVGAGIGLTYSRHKGNINAPSVPVAFTMDDSQYNFAYALMAGASYKVSDNASVDLGYQFLDTPNMETYDHNTLQVRKGSHQHQIRLGLRYDLW